MNDQDLKIKLLQEEIKALRSVLSEIVDVNDKYGGVTDLNGYTQWQKAEAIEELLKHIK